MTACHPAAVSRRQGRGRARGDDGAFLVLYALAAVAVLTMAAIVVDLAALRQDRAADRLAADLAVTAGALRLDPGDASSPAAACQSAWDYFVTNAAHSEPSVTPPDCATAMGAVACTSSTPIRTASGTAGPWQVQISHPVPDSSPLMAAERLGGDQTQAADPGIDGHPCDRIGVRIIHQRDLALAGVVGLGSAQTDVHSVARLSEVAAAGQLTELIVTDPSACATVQVAAGSELLVTGTGQAADVAVDSDGTGCAGGTVIDIHGSAELAASSAAGATIRSYALAGPAPATAYEPADAGVRLTPTPSPALARTTRLTGDRRWNCAGASCPPASDHIDQAEAALGSGLPLIWDGLVFSPWPGVCDVLLPTVVLEGNWYVNCPVLNVASSLSFAGGTIVTAGTVRVATGGCLAVADSACGALAPPDRDNVLFLQAGDLEVAAGGHAHLHRTFVRLPGTAATTTEGRLLVDGDPATGALRWTAPQASRFEDLLLWTESGGGQRLEAPPTVLAEGTLFAPNAQVEVAAPTGAATLAVQLITGRVLATGGLVTLSPLASRAVTDTTRTARLLR